MIHVQSQAKLVEIVAARGPVGCGPHALHGWEDQPHEHGNDCNHHE